MIGKFFRFIGFALVTSVVSVAVTAYFAYRYLEPLLPDVEVLSDIRYQIPMTVYSRDGLLMAEYGEKKRIPIAIKEIPPSIIQAFLAAEDKNFFDHPGVDYEGLARAAFSFLRTGEKRQGGSTITMQVARNFFLSNEKTILRKINEILLAIKIESKLSKERILELYLNKIYFGQHAYGIAAAADVYYAKTVNELSLDEIAMIAGLPKAPSAFNPIVNPERAISRRDYVLARMKKLGYIHDADYTQAVARPVTAKLHSQPVELYVPYVSEMVRNEMFERYGEDAYTNGYRVYTTFDSRLQLIAEKTVRVSLHNYDQRHGYRANKQSEGKIDLQSTSVKWEEALSQYEQLGETIPALVIGFSKEGAAEVYLRGGQQVTIGVKEMRWAYRYINENRRGGLLRNAKEVMKPGDIIRIQKDTEGKWLFSQVPEVEGALVSLDAKDGAILSLAGGYDFARSKFNRAIQGQRQPGSGFKPILYAAALSEGYTPSSIVNDAPISYTDSGGNVWRPHNYSGRYYGPTSLRVALAKSRNLVSIRLLKAIGLKKTIEMAKEFGFEPEELPHAFPLALGSGSATPLRMAQAFSVFANGGFRVNPYFIERVETSTGKVIYQAAPQTACIECDETYPSESRARRILSPSVHAMMHSMLQDVVRMGTATDAKKLGRTDIGGKTGTTNDYRDAWFNGYVPGYVTVAWIGFDSFKSLGSGETGGHTALPLWIHYMKEALKEVSTSDSDFSTLHAEMLEDISSKKNTRRNTSQHSHSRKPAKRRDTGEGAVGSSSRRALETIF